MKKIIVIAACFIGMMACGGEEDNSSLGQTSGVEKYSCQTNLGPMICLKPDPDMYSYICQDAQTPGASCIGGPAELRCVDCSQSPCDEFVCKSLKKK